MAAPATRYRHLAELALDFLHAEGVPRAPGILAARLFAAAGAAGPFVRLVDELLAGDGRFVRDAAGDWGLAGWRERPSTLTGAAFAVIDVETTGGGEGGRGTRWAPEGRAPLPGARQGQRILEVAAVLIDGGEVTGRYQSLLNPQRPVPATVTALTGITQEMAEAAPTADAVLPELLAQIGDRILVGHNVGADLAALNYEALWNDLPPLGNVALDTEELAMRVLPDLRRPSLARVAGALGLASPQRHRALADASLTATVLRLLLARLPEVAGEGVGTVAGLQQWLSSGLEGRQARVRRVTSRLPSGTLRVLPDAPGVYAFRDGAGEVLYVGKAASLRSRVAQHFSGTARALRRHDGLLERTAAVSHETVACELDALLLESRQIRTLRPPYNVQARSRQGCPFLRLEIGPFPRAGATRTVDPSGPCAGPYRTTQQVRHTLDVLRRVFQIRSCRRVLPATRARMRIPCLRLGQGLCPAPCAGAVTPEQYGVLVDFAWRFVTAGRDATLEALDGRLAALEPAGDPWEREVLRECRSRLRRLRREYRPVGGGLAGGALVMAYPDQGAAENPDPWAPGEGGGAVLFFVRDGRLTRRVQVPASTLTVAGLTAVVAEGLAAPEAESLDADQTSILLRWIYRHSGRPECVPVPPGTPPDAVSAAILEALDTPVLSG